MYGTRPGFYLLVGPNWKGEVPKGITKVFRSKTNSGVVGPRVFVDDTPEDKRAVQELVSQIDMYPLAEFDGKMKRHDWTKVSKFPGAESKEEVRWVFPDKFVDQLPAVLRDAPPLPGEEARYAEMLSVIEAANKDPALKQAITFWSLTLYNEQHFFEPNPINRYSIGTKNKDLKLGADGSLMIYVQPDEPNDPEQRANWLPSPRNKDFSLFMRAYWAEPAALDGSWTPPAVEKVK